MIGSGNDYALAGCQPDTRTNADLLSMVPLRTNPREIIKIKKDYFKNMEVKVQCVK